MCAAGSGVARLQGFELKGRELGAGRVARQHLLRPLLRLRVIILVAVVVGGRLGLATRDRRPLLVGHLRWAAHLGHDGTAPPAFELVGEAALFLALGSNTRIAQLLVLCGVALQPSCRVGLWRAVVAEEKFPQLLLRQNVEETRLFAYAPPLAADGVLEPILDRLEPRCEQDVELRVDGVGAL
eukprot:7390837-Prymnesium_polylepis.1